MREIETRGAGARVEAELSRRLAAALDVPQSIGAGDLRPALDALRRAVLQRRGSMLPPATAEARLDQILDACEVRSYFLGRVRMSSTDRRKDPSASSMR